MKRAGLAILAVVSLLLCAAAVALWVRSYRVGYSVSYTRAEQGETQWRLWTWHASLEPSCIYVQRWTSPPQPVSVHMGGPNGQVFELRPTFPEKQVHWYGEKARKRWDGAFARRSLRWELGRFAWVASDGSGVEWLRLMVAPLYAVVLVLAVLPVVWVRGILGRRMAAGLAAGGMCCGCGYDLRASEERCPECGLVYKGAVEGGRGLSATLVNRARWRPDWVRWLWAMGATGMMVAALVVPMLMLLWWVVPPPQAMPLP